MRGSVVKACCTDTLKNGTWMVVSIIVHDTLKGRAILLRGLRKLVGGAETDALA